MGRSGVLPLPPLRAASPPPHGGCCVSSDGVTSGLQSPPALGASGVLTLGKTLSVREYGDAELHATRFAASLDIMLAAAEGSCPQEVDNAWLQDLMAKVGLLRDMCRTEPQMLPAQASALQ